MHVGPKEPDRPGDQPVEVDVCDRCPGRDALQEQRLDAVEVAESGEVALVEQGQAHLTEWVGTKPAYRFGLVEAVVKHIRTQVAHDRVLVRGQEQVDDGKPVADGDPGHRPQHDPDLVVRPAAPPLVGRVEVPRAVHPEMRVQRHTALDPGQQVLAAGHDLQDLAS